MSTNKWHWVYHYTDADSLRMILRDGVIRASSTRLYRDLAMTAVARDTPPLVWLSVNPVMEMTTFVKLTMLHRSPVGLIGRVALPYPYGGDLGLSEYTEQAGIPYEDWTWNVRTGELAGSNYTTWRVVPHDVPGSDFHHAELVYSMDSDGFTWEKING